VCVMRGILSELPNYKNGPYADIRKWVLDEIDVTRSRARIVNRDSIAVRREGAAQIALVGPPNAGKSSLLHALSDVQIKIGDYASTTLRPVPALVRIDGVPIQFVEIPGLLDGANDDHGGGRAYLGVLREADAIVYCQDATAVPDDLRSVMAEVGRAGIKHPALLALTKFDDAYSEAVARGGKAFPGLSLVTTSVLDDASLARLRAEAWCLTGLIRVYVRDGGNPFALATGSTVLDVAAAIHSDLVRNFRGARVWGPSARFEGQRVGRDHVVLEGNTLEVLTV
jgi:uncharacterized protein